MLCTAKIYPSNFKKEDTSREKLINSLKNANEIIGETIEHVGNITKDLMPGYIKKFRLTPALMDICHHISQGGIHKLKFKETGIASRFDPKMELGIYRIVIIFIAICLRLQLLRLRKIVDTFQFRK